MARELFTDRSASGDRHWERTMTEPARASLCTGAHARRGSDRSCARVSHMLNLITSDIQRNNLRNQTKGSDDWNRENSSSSRSREVRR